MNTDTNLSLFVEGNNPDSNKITNDERGSFFSTVTTYFLWTLIGVGTALAFFSKSPNRQVKHMVVFKYKPETTPEQIKVASSAFKELRYKIPGIVSFEHGDNISAENKSKGFNHVYLLTFKNAAARDAYLPHPEHSRFSELINQLAVVEDEFVVDF
jgi:hypothetical protein